MDAILLKNISKSFIDNHYKRLTVLQDIDLHIKDGEVFVFLGPSGCGKSTLLRIMSGLEKDYGGQVVFGEGITSTDISFVFQQFALLPWLTVSENIELPLLARHGTAEERSRRVKEMLMRMGLERFSGSFPRELSGGMRQRVGIARALVTNPKILFMDEPFSELDSFIATELRRELLALWQERKLTIVMVTHIISEAVELGSRITVMTPRPGKIEKIIENPLPHPRSKRTSEFYALEDQLYALVKP